MQFKDDFPEAREVVLSENYRSGQKILDAAYGLIKHNDPNTLESKLGISKRLVSMTGFPGEAEALQFETASDEEAFVAGEIRKLVSGGKASYGDCAVLVRANSQTDPFIAELNANGIPNIFVSLKGLYYKPVIMDMIAYLKLLDNYHESSALFRVLDMNPFEIGHADIVNINRFARRKNWSLFEALSNSFAITDISRETRTKIDLLLSAVRRHSLKAKTSGIGRLFVETVHDLGILKGRDHDRDREMYSLLNQFYSKISEYEKSERGAKLKDFIAFLDMELEAGETGSLRLDYEDADTVRIMTAHAAKGLEFKYVFLVQLVDKKFPTVNRPDRIPVPDEIVREALPAGKETHLEEERRLFYVAMTRAKEKLYLTGAKDYGGATEKKMSVFIKEAGLEASGASLSAAEKDRLSRDMAFLGIPPAKVCVYQPPKTFSFSQIEAYNNCPLQYKFNFVLKIPVVPKGSFVFGRVLHGILFDLFAGLARGGQASLFGEAAPAKPSLDDLLGIFKKNWQEEGYESKEEKEKYRKLGLEIISNFYSELEREGWPTVEFLEKSFMVKIGDYPFKGAIDRIDLLPDGAWEVIDYKTGETPENFYYQNKRQLLLYKIALEENTDKRIGRLTFHYLKSGEKKSFEAKDKDIEKLKAEITETVKKICSGEFQPNPGMLCRFCDFRNICEFRK